MPEEYLPYIRFQAAREGRELKGDERIAMLNVSTTTSYIPVFLDRGKTIEDVEREVAESSAVLNKDSRRILRELLEGGK
ncbi:MAG: DUF749 domain-containing protein [Methanobacteriota archaeon]|nr:MAG: DUF749 domain-containing protein [Euryarchaeota archaeon]